MKNRFFLSIIFFLFIIPGCTQIPRKTALRRVSINTTSLVPNCIGNPFDQKPTITIWIHGTRFFPRGICEQFFFSKPGLHHYSKIDKKYHQHKIASTLIQSNTSYFNEKTFYLFGWSGALSFKEREIAARTLYEDLKQVRQDYYQQYKCEPKIRIIAHSHGGNIALLLNQVKDADDSSFVIDDLILLACPAQAHTMSYAHSPTFNRVYSLYSMLDILQIVDPQGLQKTDPQLKIPLFSQRLFPHHDKIEQVAVKINDRSIMHVEFVKLKFLTHLPTILAEIDQWRTTSQLPSNTWSALNKCISVTTKSKKKPT